jgi:hypothetical protein
LSKKPQSTITPEARELIQLTAKTTAAETATKFFTEGTGKINYYRAVETLLYNYNKLRKLVENEEDYTAVMLQKKSTSFVTFSPNAGYTDKTDDDIFDEIKHQKEMSYQRTKTQFEGVERIINLFKDRKEFIVIRMYYFNQDAQGNQRPADSEQYTFEEITSELSELGLLRDIKTARRWRSKIINDMAVCMFGQPAAISASTYRVKTS